MPKYLKLLKHESLLLATPMVVLLALFFNDIDCSRVLGVKAGFYGFAMFFIGFAFYSLRERRIAHEKDFREKLRAIVFDTDEAIVVTDSLARILDVNAEFCLITGFGRDEVIGRSSAILESSGMHDKKFYAAMWDKVNNDNRWSGEVFDRRKNGELYVKWLSIAVVRDADKSVISYVSKFYDMSNIKRSGANMPNAALSDILTGLPNRRRFQSSIIKALNEVRFSTHYGALLFINLDNFKHINDAHGHDAGDILLIESARRIESCVDDDGMVARIGGDEFIVLLSDIGTIESDANGIADTVASSIVAAFCEPMLFSGKTFNISPSIGVTTFHSQTKSTEDILKHAYAAMRTSKKQGKNRVNFCSLDMTKRMETDLYIENSLRDALFKCEMSLMYQPKVNYEGRLSGGEALLRWTKDGCSIPPVDFIKIAEKSGSIIHLGFWVLEETCAQIKKWEDAEILSDKFYLSVNVSPIQMSQAGFTLSVVEILDRVGVQRKRIKIEITESSVMENIDDAVAKIKSLKDAGIDVVMDDFGTGYSSLSYLRKLPISQIKIDKSFVDNIEFNREDEAIVSMIIGLGRVLRVSVLAEGVENEHQYRMLEMAGCTYFQGYYFGRPMVAEVFEDLLRGGSESIRLG